MTDLPPTDHRVGRRVVVRHRRPAGSHPPLTDVVGVLTAVDDETLTVTGRAGVVRIARADVVVVKAVPPAPVRRGRPHTAVGTLDLERTMADGWRAVEEQWLGGWLLRASSGWTTRGNSVLPLGDPGVDLAAAVERVEQWYADRGLAPMAHVSVPTGGDPGDDELGMLLLDRGYERRQPTLVMTGAAGDVEPLRDGAAPVHVSPTLEPAWLEAYARQREVLPGVTESVLTGSAGQLFLSTTDRAGTTTGVARVSVHAGWAGLQAVWVDPDRRGRGLGRTLLHAAAMLARQRRMPSMYLQVEADHDAAVRLYESEGFRTHHEYAYLRRVP